MKLAITFCVLSLLIVGCSHTPPEKSSTEAEIQQHIVGQWTVSTNSDEGVPGRQYAIASDGCFWRVHPDGTRELLGQWKLENQVFVLYPVSTNYPTSFYPVIFADEHELVCAPGFSAGGRIRFTK
jgi:hypothetical protein